MKDYDFGALFAGMTRVQIVPRYRMNREAPANERISFVVEAPTVAALGEWQALANAAAEISTQEGAPALTQFAPEDSGLEPLLAAIKVRRDYFARHIVEVRTGTKPTEITDETRPALVAHLETAARLPLFVELELEWRALGVVDDDSEKDSAR